MGYLQARPVVLSIIKKNGEDWLTTREIALKLGESTDLVRRACYSLREEELIVSTIVKGSGGMCAWKINEDGAVKDNQPIKRFRKSGELPGDSGEWWETAPNRQAFYDWRRT